MPFDEARGEKENVDERELDWKVLGSDANALKGAMRLFPSGVTVVTTGSGDQAEGMTANAVISVSLDPPLFLVSIHKEARINGRIREEGYYAVNILAGDQEGLSRLFASPERSSGLPAVHSLGGGSGTTGAPLAAGALAVVECEVDSVYPAGDHDLFLGRLVGVRLGDAKKGPLVYHEGGYPTLKSGPAPGDSGAFVDSVRGFDARLSRLGKKRRR